MALHFHKLAVKEIRKETPDCVSIAFDLPAAIRDEFNFKAGQNVTIKTDLDDTRRSYSICSSPLENELRVAVKKIKGGVFSCYANDTLKTGDLLEIMSPTGTFFVEINPANEKNYLFFAAGSGITPVISIIKTILQTEPKSSVTLLYGNKNVASIIFKEALEALKDKHMKRFSLYHVLSRETTDSEFNNGRIDVAKCDQLSEMVDFNTIDDFFICGPEQLIFTVRDFLQGWGIDPKKIHFELFTTPTRKNTKVYTAVKEPEEEGSAITVKLDGRTFDFRLDYNGNTILDAALDEGADAPFACKGGVCCTCKAKVLEGQVEMESNYGLDKSEVKDGFVLTCQSHPRSKKVVIDYDAT